MQFDDSAMNLHDLKYYPRFAYNHLPRSTPFRPDYPKKSSSVRL